MITARAPLRISFAGGSTDLPTYYRRHEGMVVSVALAHYVSATLTQGESSTYPDATTQLYVNSALGDLQKTHNVEISSDLPYGTGLGSSGALMVALVAARRLVTDAAIDPAGIAEEACVLEMQQPGASSGKQDQYAAAFGGLNAFYFDHSGVRVEPLPMGPATTEWLNTYLTLFLFPNRHYSHAILDEVQKRAEQDDNAVSRLHELRTFADHVRDAIIRDEPNAIGEIIDASWKVKRATASGVTTPEIDVAVAAAQSAGAIGCKVTGAGGGGCLLVVAPPSNHADIATALTGQNLSSIKVAFDFTGVAVANSAAAVHS